jgi:exopolyphosphatase/guanosine-5'-triphosphate,3'-diphosphate pyrophosphatase
LKFAAIDIGTNAVRLLLSRVIEDGKPPFFKKETLVRMPIRLGEDAFLNRRISSEKIDLLTDTMIGFKHLIRAYPARDYMAVATSAFREADNGPEIADVIRQQTGVNLEIINGQQEAEYIYANHIEELLPPGLNYLYVDVGGGSTEIIVNINRQVVASRSFKIGTVRMLQNKIEDQTWDELKDWVKTNTGNHRPLVGVGTGGNINKMFKMARIKEGEPISFKRIKSIFKTLKSCSYEERITRLGLKPDRADVIIPAARIYLSVLKWTKAQWMYVPQIGLPDGIIHLLYRKYQENSGAA